MNDIKWSHVAWHILTAQMHPPNINHWLRKKNAEVAKYAKQKHLNPFWQFACLTADWVCWQSPTVHFRLQPEAQRRFSRHVKTTQQTLNILPRIMKQTHFLRTIYFTRCQPKLRSRVHRRSAKLSAPKFYWDTFIPRSRDTRTLRAAIFKQP